MGFSAGKAAAEAALEPQLEVAEANAAEIRGFVEAARESYGDPGGRAAEFLVAGMPAADLKSLKKDFLMENLSLAFKAREEFPWARDVPEERFFNDVLPYASLDETRESWRPGFYEKAKALVRDCKTATEAVQVLNRDFFNQIQVHYHTGRKAPNQSPAESMASGKATCTGLSIILVNACRAVGIPARVAGVALWTGKNGNHTWVEIHDGTSWHFTGADEYDKNGLNRAWFVADAAQAVEGMWQHAIWASSWQKTGSWFPLVWDIRKKAVPGVNVTSRYIKSEDKEPDLVSVHLRLWDKTGGERLVGDVRLVDSIGRESAVVQTKAGTADLNDMPAVMVTPELTYRVLVTREGEVRWQDLKIGPEKKQTIELVWADLARESERLRKARMWLEMPDAQRPAEPGVDGLSKEEVGEVLSLFWRTLKMQQQASRKADIEAKRVRAGGKEMRYLEKVFGEAPEGEKSLWISMHGGGGAPPQINDQQWLNQIRLYAPQEGIVIAPRAPTDSWNLWHEAHIDDLFQALIDQFVTERGVSPDKVYLMGYSAGGDGVYQLAPRMADRFAAASMMAGHPNDAKPEGLRNLPFMIFMGGKDAAYDRNKVAAKWGDLLDMLHQGDPEGYDHKTTIYPEFGHWMNGKDQEALPWMAERKRTSWPRKVVWAQSARTHDRFYWLALPPGSAKAGQIVRASVSGQEIDIAAEGTDRLKLRLSDALLDLDQAITVRVNGKERFKGLVKRSAASIWQSLSERMDRSSVSSAELMVECGL